MRKKLFVIEDVFQITGRGIVVTGEIESDSFPHKIGSKVVLVKPSGEKLLSKVIGIDYFTPIDGRRVNRNKVGVLLDNIILKEDVPIGTEVFLD
jgi:translation elongation factor EF-Tu-like GTPase